MRWRKDGSGWLDLLNVIREVGQCGLDRSARTLHGSKAAHLEHQPGGLLDMLGGAGGIANLAIGIVLVDQVHHNRTTLEDTLRAIEECGDAAVGVNLQEPAAEELLSACCHNMRSSGAYSSFWALVLMLTPSVL